jgi:hypothetical protein
MSFIRSTALTALALTLATACAPETRSTDPSAAEVPFQSGSLSGTTLGRIGPAQTTSGPGATLTGLVGTFTSLSATGSGSGGVATVYFTALGTGPLPFPSEIWQVRTDGTGLLKLSPEGAPGQIGPSISPSGNRLLFSETGQASGNGVETHLTERLADGTTRQLITDNDVFTPVAWTPDEQAVVYPLLTEEAQSMAIIRRLSLDSLTLHDLVPGHPGVRLPELTVGAVNGHSVMIYRNDEGGLNLFDLTTGLDTVHFTPLDSGFVNGPDLTRDGSRLLFVLTRQVSPGEFRSQLRAGDVNHPEAAESLFNYPGGGQFTFGNDARWLPDGSGFVATMVVGASDPHFQLQLLDARGHVIRQLTSLPRGVQTGGFSIGPAAAASQVLVGEDGLLGSTASGIIFGQGVSGGLTSVVGFQSDRPRSVTLKANTGLNSTGPALTYTLTAEQLRTLRFINGPPGGGLITVVDSASGPAGGALINFDSDNGAVTLVLPFAEGGSHAVTVTESGGTRIFRGNFLSAWKSRSNLAPQGATEVKLETSSGKVEVTP